MKEINLPNFDNMKEINLPNFILEGGFGYEIDKKNSNKGWLLLKSEVNKLLIRNQPNDNGHWIFSNVVGDEKGTIIDFLLMEGINPKDFFMEEYKSVSLPILPTIDVLPPSKSKEEIKKIFSEFWHEEKENYLLDRGISSKVIWGLLDGSFPNLKTNIYGAVFPLFSDVGTDLEGEFSSLARFNSKRAKYLPGEKRCLGSPKGLSILKTKKGFDELFLCESPIDALSLETLHQNHGIKGQRAYISTCGPPSISQLGNLKKLLPALKCKVILAFDADDTGRRYTEEVKAAVDIPFKVKFPKEGKKDWNEVLSLKAKPL